MRKLYTFFIILFVGSNLFAQDCPCIFSDGVWENNDFMGDNPTLSAIGDNWELSSSIWISTEGIDNGDGTTTNNIVYGAGDTNTSMLTGDCYNGVVTISINYTTDSNGDITGDIIFSISSNDGFDVSSTSSIIAIDVDVDGNLTATGNIASGNSGQSMATECQECCDFADGTWVNEHVAGMDGMNPTISGYGDNWELLSAAWLSTDEIDNGDGTITSTAYYGADADNYSKLISECYTGVVSVSTTYTSDTSNNQIIGDIVFTLSDEVDFNYSSTGSVTDFDFGTATLTGSILGSFSGNLSDIDTDGDGVGDCDEIEGCMDLEACNYSSWATEDDGSCLLVTVENNIQCDECCVFSDGTWLNEHFAGMDGMTPTVSGIGANWELTSAIWMETIETDNGDGTIKANAYYGADIDNTSTLTSDCYTGVVGLLISYTLDSEDNIIGDLEFHIYDDADFVFSSSGSITGVDMETFTLTGSLLGGNAGNLIIIDSDGDGVGDCDESTGLDEDLFGFHVFPNPSKDGVINIIGHDENLVINVFDNIGQLILSVEECSNNTTLDLSSFGKGLYFIQLNRLEVYPVVVE